MWKCAGLVLCGGGSRRMGRPKLTLPFGPEVMLARVTRLLGQAVQPVIVVAAYRQQPPELPAGVLILHDRHENRGPLEGLAVGLRALSNRAEAAFVAACDVPLLRPEFVRRMIELSAGYDIAVPRVDGFDHPLCAVYRTDVLPQIEALLAADRLRLSFLFDQIRTRRVTAEELIDVDPQLRSLANVNSPADYRAALVEAGLQGSSPDPPPVCG